jgi:hypothetical protein
MPKSTSGTDIGNTNLTGSHYKTGGGIVTIEIAGTIPKTQYGQISLGGGAKVKLGNSVLRVVLANSFVPTPGMNFIIMVVQGTITGDFKSKDLPSVQGVSWQTSVVSESVWLKYVLRAV